MIPDGSLGRFEHEGKIACLLKNTQRALREIVGESRILENKVAKFHVGASGTNDAIEGILDVVRNEGMWAPRAEKGEMPGLADPLEGLDVRCGDDAVVGKGAIEVEKECVLFAHAATFSRQGTREMTKGAPRGAFICGRYWTRTSDLFRVKETR